MSMTDVTDQVDRPADYSGKYFIARVMATVDPKKCHRIKIMIPDLIEGDVANLPWAIPGAITGGIGPNETHQWIPEEGSKVYVTLQDGDVNFPVYHGGVPSFDSVRGVLAENYPHRVGFQLNSYTETNSGDDRKVTFSNKGDPTPYPEKGHHFFIDRSTNVTEYKHPQGTKINIDSNGKTTLIVENTSGPPADLIVDVTKGNANIHVKGNADIHVEGNVTSKIDGNFTGTVQGFSSLTSQGAMTLTSATGITMQAPTINSIGAAMIGMTAPTIVTSGLNNTPAQWNGKGNFGLDGTLHVTQDAQFDANLHANGTVSDGDGVDTA